MSGVRLLGALVEAAVEGEQFSVQVFDGRSIGLTHQQVGPPPSFITVGVDFPYLDDPYVHRRIVQHAEQVIAAIGHTRGPCSIDIRYNSQGAHVIEINPRLAGDMISENIRISTGIDLVEATLRFRLWNALRA